jgi:hypothetical protein
VDISDKIQEFYKRWDIQKDTSQIFEEFKNRTLNSLNIMFETEKSMNFEGCNYFDIEFMLKIGEQIITHNDIYHFKDTYAYKLMRYEENFKRYIFYLQVLFWQKNVPNKNKIFNLFQEDIKRSLIDINLVKEKGEYIFYPAGAELLDEKLVNDVLHWIVEYDDVYSNFKNALEQYQSGENYRNCVDNMRLSLELFLKHVLNNGQVLRNQKGNLLKYLSVKGISKEIINMYNTLISYYDDYNNAHSKHWDNVNSNEIEFIIYLTGIFMRMILTNVEKE